MPFSLQPQLFILFNLAVTATPQKTPRPRLRFAVSPSRPACSHLRFTNSSVASDSDSPKPSISQPKLTIQTQQSRQLKQKQKIQQ